MTEQEKTMLKQSLDVIKNAFQDSQDAAYEWLPDYFDDWYEEGNEAREKLTDAEVSFNDTYEKMVSLVDSGQKMTKEEVEEAASKLGLVVLPKDGPTEALRQFLRLHMAFRLENFHKVDKSTDKMVEDLTNHFLKYSDVLFRYDDIDSIIYSYLRDKEEQEC